MIKLDTGTKLNLETVMFATGRHPKTQNLGLSSVGIKTSDNGAIIVDKYSKTTIDNIDKIYVNRGPGSFAGIRNSLSIVKAFNVGKNIDYYCYSIDDFKGEEDISYENIPNLCDKFKIKKNLINPIYLS